MIVLFQAVIGGMVKLKQEMGSEYHLTFTKESGELKHTYLCHRNAEGSKGEQLAAETESVLEEYDSTDTVQAILLDNTSTNTGMF